MFTTLAATCLLSMTGMVAIQDEEAPAPESRVIRVKDDESKLRAGSGAAFRALRTLSEGDLLIKVRERAGFFQVEVPQGFPVFVASRFIERTGHGKGMINASGVNLRPYPSSDPSANSLPVGQLPELTEVLVLDEVEGWTKILAPPALKAWIYADLVEDVGLLNEARGATIKEIWDASYDVALESLGPDPDHVKREQEETKRGEELTEIESRVDELEAMILAVKSARKATSTEADQEETEGVEGEGAELESEQEDPKDLEPPSDSEGTRTEGSGGDSLPFPEMGDVSSLLARVQAIESEAVTDELKVRAQGTRDRLGKIEDEIRQQEALVAAMANPELGSSKEDKKEAPNFDLSKPIEPFQPKKLTPYAYSKYQAVGWISVVSSDREAPVHIRKSGKTIFRLSCPDKRFNLVDFVNKEVGVYGVIKAVDGAPDIIEVDRLVILSR